MYLCENCKNGGEIHLRFCMRRVYYMKKRKKIQMLTRFGLLKGCSVSSKRQTVMFSRPA